MKILLALCLALAGCSTRLDEEQYKQIIARLDSIEEKQTDLILKTEVTEDLAIEIKSDVEDLQTEVSQLE